MLKPKETMSLTNSKENEGILTWASLYLQKCIVENNTKIIKREAFLPKQIVIGLLRTRHKDEMERVARNQKTVAFGDAARTTASLSKDK